MSLHENHTFHIVNKRPWPLTGAIGAIVTLIGLIKWFRWHLIRNRSNHYRINYNPVMTWRNPGGDLPRITHKDSNNRPTMRNNPIYCIRSLILRLILLSILPYKSITNNWTRIHMTTRDQKTHSVPQYDKYSTAATFNYSFTPCT
jgi:hypothetical protein